MTVQLNPHAEDLLKQHLAKGRFASAEEVIERALKLFSIQDNTDSGAPAEIGHEDFEHLLDRLAIHSGKIPLMPGETFSRGMIYR